MMRVSATGVMAALLCGCCKTLPAPEAPSYANADTYVGEVANAVQAMDSRLRDCANARKIAASHYNSLSLGQWWWEFVTGVVGVGGQTAAGVLLSFNTSSNHLNDWATGTSAVTGAATGLSVAIKALSGLSGSLADANKEYEKYNSAMVLADDAFQKLTPKLQGNDSAAIEQVKALNTALAGQCPPGSPP